MEQENNSKEFNEKFLGSYQQEMSDPTNKNHQFDSEKSAADGQVKNPTMEELASLSKNVGCLS